VRRATSFGLRLHSCLGLSSASSRSSASPRTEQGPTPARGANARITVPNFVPRRLRSPGAYRGRSCSEVIPAVQPLCVAPPTRRGTHRPRPDRPGRGFKKPASIFRQLALMFREVGAQACTSGGAAGCSVARAVRVTGPTHTTRALSARGHDVRRLVGPVDGVRAHASRTGCSGHRSRPNYERAAAGWRRRRSEELTAPGASH